MNISDCHHYVPEWYQRRFLPGGKGEFHVLDKTPPTSIRCPDGAIRRIKPREMRRCGSDKLFQKSGLYSVALSGVREDSIERFLFGPLDNQGARANAMFRSWPRAHGFGPIKDIASRYGHPSERMGELIEFMDAQKARTPKGIDQIRYYLARSGRVVSNNTAIMGFLMQRRKVNCTVWAEAVWEIFSAKKSAVKFLLSDDPVLIYNCDCYPGSDVCRYPYDPNPFWRGSRVIYPLSSEAILVLTHVEHADDPSRQKAKRPRRNARSHDHVILSYTDVVNERELSDEEIITINYAIKMRATRWIASVTQDHLYPERMVAPIRWCEIDKLFYTKFPSMRSKSEIMVRYNDDTLMYSNAFGERDVVPGWFVRKQERGSKE